MIFHGQYVDLSLIFEIQPLETGAVVEYPLDFFKENPDDASEL